MSNSQLDKQAAYKEAFIKGMIQAGENLVTKVKGSYVADAVRSAHMQHLRAAAEDPMTLHGTLLSSLEQHGAIGAKTLHKALNKGRVALGDLDTALGAMAIGKDGMQDPSSKTLRKTLFTFKKDNYRTVKGSDGFHTLVQQSRPSISAPLTTVSSIGVPMLAMAKGNELIQQHKQPKEVNPSGE